MSPRLLAPAVLAAASCLAASSFVFGQSPLESGTVGVAIRETPAARQPMSPKRPKLIRDLLPPVIIYYPSRTAAGQLPAVSSRGENIKQPVVTDSKKTASSVGSQLKIITDRSILLAPVVIPYRIPAASVLRPALPNASGAEVGVVERIAAGPAKAIVTPVAVPVNLDEKTRKLSLKIVPAPVKTEFAPARFQALAPLAAVPNEPPLGEIAGASADDDSQPVAEMVATTPPPIGTATTGLTAVGPIRNEPVAPPAEETKLEVKAETVATAPSVGSSITTVVTSDVIRLEARTLNNSAVELTRELRYEEAVELLRRAVAADPGSFKLHRNLSIVYENMKAFDQALVAAEIAVRLAPAEPSALTQLCGLQLMLGLLPESVGCYEKLRTLGPLDAMNQTFYGVSLLRNGKLEAALPILEDAANGQPDSAPTLNALGVCYYNTKNYEKAADSFKRAVELLPDRSETRFNLAIAQLAMRNKEGALSQYRLLKTDNPKLAEQLYRILYADKVVRVGELKP